eukprot:CAMPEP_0201498702 /NCGR_PEP_ID=MMETSP0151_2-20130828/72559_1 /ASSEMBLY_ACC=CAM_ASM_000257 /TAXON_ID=200890 /ORGANISM="Paramoeba atlantica, Strain 621/1 / CCAP 1560/9" /LENGTH=44 /DNA_ID= /DNA_START= /DNA_END= /DNA_ORIENTATION=
MTRGERGECEARGDGHWWERGEQDGKEENEDENEKWKKERKEEV